MFSTHGFLLVTLTLCIFGVGFLFNCMNAFCINSGSFKAAICTNKGKRWWEAIDSHCIHCLQENALILPFLHCFNEQNHRDSPSTFKLQSQLIFDFLDGQIPITKPLLKTSDYFSSRALGITFALILWLSEGITGLLSEESHSYLPDVN